MTYSEIEKAYTNDSYHTNIQDYLKDNHDTIFYKNKIQHENPFVCGIIYGMVKAFINSNIHTEEVPNWLYQYIENNKDKFITCVSDSAISYAKNFENWVNTYTSNNYTRFNDGESHFLDFYHGEYNFNLREESRAFSKIRDISLTIDENLNGKLAIFLNNY